MIRLFVADDLTQGNAEVRLTKAQAHYLTHVMRLKAGDGLALFNGRDGEAPAVLRDARAGVLQLRAPASGFVACPDLWLVVALIKRAPLESIVEKATELGVRRILLTTTRRTNAERTNLERLRRIAIEAAEQTGRMDAPALAGPEPLVRLLDGWDPGRRLMYCDEAGDDPQAQWGGAEGRARPALEGLGEQPRGAPWAVLIGPEGGFDPAERARLRGLDFVMPVTLGPRILRADTAAIAALTLWQAAIGDWRA
jgi:16S rRNA (uracil1498-N3)-methyltransferase